MYLATASQAKQIEQAIVLRTGGSTYGLMEAVGAQAAKFIASSVKEEAVIVIVCGGGNNGGDGLVAARILDQKKYHVSVFSTIDPSQWEGDVGSAFQSLQKTGLNVININDKANTAMYEESLKKADLVLDCIIGSGLSREVAGVYKYAIESINNFARLIYSIDIPSGFDADSGAAIGSAIKAAKTLAAGTVKQGITQYPCAGNAGDIVFLDMGASREELEKYTFVRVISEEAAAKWLPARPSDSHKNVFGVVGIVAGSLGMGGAAYLASQACLRAGAGLVYLFAPKSVATDLQAKITETIIVPLSESNAGSLSSSSVRQVLNSVAGVIVIGPGLSTRDETKLAIRQIISETTASLVVDASAIDALINQEALLKNNKRDVIITPHPGELSRLIKVPVEEIQSNRIKYASEVSAGLNCIVVLKGARTVIAAPNGKVYVCIKGNSGMATAGAGDVLSGIIGAFLGQKMEAFHAAALGAEIHGAAGDFAVDDLTEYSLIASDLIDYLPVAFKYYKELQK